MTDQVQPAKRNGGLPKSKFSDYTLVKEYCLAALAAGVATGVGFTIRPWSDYWAVAVVYLFTIILLGLRLRQGPILFAATVCALTWDYLFFPPLFSFMLLRLQDWMMFGLFFAIALVTGRLTGHIRQQEQTERQRAQRATAMYQLTRTLASAHSSSEVLRHAAEHVWNLFEVRLALLIFDSAEPSRLMLDESAAYLIAPSERAAAEKAFFECQRSGIFRLAQSETNTLFFPLLAAGHLLGVMAVPRHSSSRLSHAQRDLLEGFSTQIAFSLEHEELRAVNEAARMQTESDRLHRTLLDNVSHELKTPLAVISSASETLFDLVPASGRGFVQEIRLATERLRHLVTNLLNTTRLDSGGLRLQLDWCDLADLINAALKLTRDIRKDRTLRLHLPVGLPLVKCDFDLVEQAIANLIHNACRHTPAKAEITISAGKDETDENVWIAVEDNGPGINDEQRAKLFERFFRGAPNLAGGLGLGLSIARGFVESHRGRVIAENRSGGGARFIIFLPLETYDNIPAE